MPPDGDRRARGAACEAAAEALLRGHGMTTVARNYRCRAGEIDLVMLERDTLVFVEVRYRRSARYGGAAASVDARKQARIVRAALHFLACHRAHAARPCRFDVVAVDGAPPRLATDWISGAFSA